MPLSMSLSHDTNCPEEQRRSPEQEIWRGCLSHTGSARSPSSLLTEVGLLLRVKNMEAEARTLILKNVLLCGNMSEEQVDVPEKP